MLDRHPRTQKKRKKRIRRKISAASPDSASRRPCSRRAESATFFTNASFFLAAPFGRRPSRMHGHENTERPVASRLDRIPGKKQRVMTVRRPLSSPEPSFLPSFHLVPSTPFPCTAIVSAPREPLAWGEGPEFRTRRQKTVLGERRSTRGHKKGPGGARAGLFPCSNSCNSPLNAPDPPRPACRPLV